MNELRIINDDGHIIARENLYIALFKRTKFAKMAQATAGVLDRWLDMVPVDSLKWCVTSPTQEGYKPFGPTPLNQCRKLLNSDMPPKKDIYIDLVGPQPYGSDFRFQLIGRREPRKAGFLDQTNLIELRFPKNFMDSYGNDAFVQFVSDCFEKLACDSGLATYGYSAGSDADYGEATTHVMPLALRHPGMDLGQNRGIAQWLGKKCRGARWLTMLSDDLVTQIGGNDRIRELERDGIIVVQLDGGYLLRAGNLPEIGDTNRNTQVPLLKAIARAIEPVTYFHDNSLLPLLNHDPDKRDRWERRFWEDDNE